MENFLLFQFAQYYPSGGMEDFVASYSSLEEAKEELEQRKTQGRVWHIYDLSKMRIVATASWNWNDSFEMEDTQDSGPGLPGLPG